MQESARAAFSYVRSRAESLGLKEDFFKGRDIHIHVPAGAQPKDGPSAGVTMVTALASMALGIPIDPKVGMTGEVTLRGQVLPVGGVKEKVLAAHRAGLKTVIMPKRNEADLDDLPADVLRDIEFHFVETVADVLKIALRKSEKKSKRRANGSKSRSASKKISPKRKQSA